MRFLSSHGKASSPVLGAFGAHGTASTGSEAKLDLDDLLVAGPGRRPTATDLTLWATGLFVFPINREIGEGIAVVCSCLPSIILGSRANQCYLILLLAGKERFCINVTCIHQMALWEQFAFG